MPNLGEQNGGLLLEARGLAKGFGRAQALSDVSLSAAAGQVTAFIGVNGAGKSTTFRCILGLLCPDAGEVRLFGAPAGAKARRRIGFLPEERGLAAHERARDAIAFHAQLKGIRRAEALVRADRLLERVGLGGRQSEKIGALSKGNAQRVQILCALAHGPDLLLLDEPFSGLDPLAQSDLLSLLAEFRARRGAIVFSTHGLAAAESLCDRVAILAGGRTVFEGPMAEARDQARHGAVVVTADAQALTDAAAALGAEAAPLQAGGGAGEGAVRWRVLLPAGLTHPALVRSLAEHGASVLAFEPLKPDLEGAFWSLAVPAAPEISRVRAA